MRGDLILIKLASSGSYVKKGEVVAQIDAQTIQDHIDDLNDTIEAAQADVSKRKAEQAIEWENLQQTLRVRKAEYDKAKLEARGAEVKTDIEKQLLQLSLDEAEAAYNQQQSDLKFKKSAHDADVKILQLTMERHVRHRDRHLIDIKRFTMTAPMAGLVVMSPFFRSGEMTQFQLGDRVFPGQGFMKIVDPKSMQVEATMNQSESSELRIGQHASIHLDAFQGMTFDGRIYSLGALAVGGGRQNYYVRTVPVRLTIEGSDPKLIPDLSASADILVDRVDNKPIVPLAAISTGNGANYAYVKKGETFEKRKVELGLTNDTHAAVLSGLVPGDEVKLN
jgi:multidrug efflux pump subunit AcrA (membrane-fusion protein)